jgi:hypothetical protein
MFLGKLIDSFASDYVHDDGSFQNLSTPREPVAGCGEKHQEFFQGVIILETFEENSFANVIDLVKRYDSLRRGFANHCRPSSVFGNRRDEDFSPALEVR